MRRTIRRSAVLALSAGLLVGSATSSAAADPCREWFDEHLEWKARVVHLYLNDATQRELDSSVFELVQREAYLTSCPGSVAAQRDQMVGWRFVERDGDEYPVAVVESLLELGGFDKNLRHLFGVMSQDTARNEP